MKRPFYKRLGAVFLALLLCVQFVPGVASADGPDVTAKLKDKKADITYTDGTAVGNKLDSTKTFKASVSFGVPVLGDGIDDTEAVH